jgi:hypothetical protein
VSRDRGSIVGQILAVWPNMKADMETGMHYSLLIFLVNISQKATDC